MTFKVIDSKIHSKELIVWKNGVQLLRLIKFKIHIETVLIEEGSLIYCRITAIIITLNEQERRKQMNFIQDKGEKS